MPYGVPLLVYTGVLFEPRSETPSPTQAFTCGHWMLPMVMKVSLCTPRGSCDGAGKVTRVQLRPPSWVMSTIAEDALNELAKCCGTFSSPAA